MKSERCLRRLIPPTHVFVAVTLALASIAHAGPPYITDDPEPVELHHWEVYLASIYFNNRDGITATLPHVEVNYGALPDTQLHIIAPMTFVHPAGGKIQYGYGDTELGIKYRFVHESQYMPQIGTFPLAEVSTGDAKLGLGNGKTQYFVPIWIQKSWDKDKWTSYGGAGYWFNPGPGNRDWWFVGAVLQRQVTDNLALGGELFFETPDSVDAHDVVGFNLGGIYDFTEHFHLLLTAGRDIQGPTRFMYYAAVQWTF